MKMIIKQVDLCGSLESSCVAPKLWALSISFVLWGFEGLFVSLSNLIRPPQDLSA